MSRLALIGCGLVGGSLAAAWRGAGVVAQVCGFDRDPACSARARALGIVDTVAPDVPAALAQADLIVLATPVGAMPDLLQAVAAHARPQAVITDVGSTKEDVQRRAATTLGARAARFVPAHPIAGGALPGIEHASAALFRGRWVITTPDAGTDPAALERVEGNWRACGAQVERMAAAEHDRIFAAVSHLPHLLAFALVDQIAAQADGARKLRYAGAGFRDFTRIAASDPVMWRDVALANGAALSAELAQFRLQLDRLQQAVAAGDGAGLEALFARASSARRGRTFAAGNGSDDDA